MSRSGRRQAVDAGGDDAHRRRNALATTIALPSRPATLISRGATVRLRGSTTQTIVLPSRSSRAVTGRSTRGGMSIVTRD